ncbi:MAG: hypothetical protein ACLGQU_05230, partial [Acidobacteriota bacterium]
HPQWVAHFHLGEETGDERFYRANGSLQWEKSYAVDGTWTWRNYDAAGRLISTSHWRGKTLLSDSLSASASWAGAE